MISDKVDMNLFMVSLSGDFEKLNDKSRPLINAPRCESCIFRAINSSIPGPPENVASPIGFPLNKVLKSLSKVDSHAIAFVKIGGIDPLYSGAQIINLE